MEKNRQNDIIMDALAMEKKSIEKQIADLNDKLKAVTDEIKKNMAESEDYRTETFHFVFKYVTTNRFNQEEFKRENAVLFERYRAPSTSRPLKVF